MNKIDFSILIDYAHEPESLSQFLQTLADWREKGYFDLVIHILSCDGVGRDDWKKPIMGNLSYRYADFTILTTDNYGQNDNPQEIVELLAKDFIDKDELLTREWLDYHLNLDFENEEFKKTKKVKFLLEIDRKIAMTKSLRVAQFLASNYDYLALKKNNLKLTKGKIAQKSQNNFSKFVEFDLETSQENLNEKIEQTESSIEQKNKKEDLLTKKMQNLEQKNMKNTEIKDNLTKKQKERRENLEISLAQELENDYKQEKLENKTLQNDKENEKKIKVLVVSTGVGCEPFLSQPNGNLEWNEKKIWQEIWQEFQKTL